MKILVLNCGSSSLKYQLFDMSNESVLTKGLVERIGIAGSRIKHNKGSNDPVVRETDIPDHTAAIKIVLDMLLDAQAGVIKNLDELSAVGHRIVHGGEKNAKSAGRVRHTLWMTSRPGTYPKDTWSRTTS